MRSFLESEGIGVAANVWRALPLELRYLTPAADLYRRRLQAELARETLPTELAKPSRPPEGAARTKTHVPSAPQLASGRGAASPGYDSWAGRFLCARAIAA